MTTNERFRFGTPFQPKKKDFRPSSDAKLVEPAERPRSVAAFDAMVSNRPLRPPRKCGPAQVAK